jgi:cytochrome P450
VQFKPNEEACFDEESNSWYVRSHEACRQVLKDEKTFARPDQFSASARAVRGNTRSLAVLSDRDHLKLHTYLTGQVSMRASRDYRTRLIAPIVRGVLSALPTDEPVDLASQFADRIPIRVGLAMIGVDITDEEHVERIAELKRRFTRWSDEDRDDPEMTRLATEASAELKELLMPMIRERRTSPREDLASEFWRTGPSVFPDWTEVDTYAACYAFLGGGETAYAMRNALYVLLSNDEAHAAASAEPDKVIPVLVSEVLRLLGPIQWLSRIAVGDSNLCGATIKAGEAVHVAISTANRDEATYPEATSIRLDAERRPHHLAFGHGPRYCIGAILASAEIEEALLALVSQYPAARLVEPGAPVVRGHRIRSIIPVFAMLED